MQCPVFFDRGVPDILAYLRLIGHPVFEHVTKAAEVFRYNRCVFIAPPWQEIFHPDRERKQDFAEAVRTYEALATTYTACGYELIELPRAPVDKRVQFVLEIVGQVSVDRPLDNWMNSLPLLNQTARPE
jgi:predicted ATPase